MFISTFILNLSAKDNDIKSEVVTQLLETLEEQTNDTINDLKSSDTVSDADDSKPTVSAGYVQAEVQALQDQAGDNAALFNDLLTALRGTEIIAT